MFDIDSKFCQQPSYVRSLSKHFTTIFALCRENKPHHGKIERSIQCSGRRCCNRFNRHARPPYSRVVRASDNTPNIRARETVEPSTWHEGPGHSVDVPTVGIKNIDDGVLPHDHLGTLSIMRWKIGRGRKKNWSLAPRLQTAKRNEVKLLKYA